MDGASVVAVVTAHRPFSRIHNDFPSAESSRDPRRLRQAHLGSTSPPLPWKQGDNSRSDAAAAWGRGTVATFHSSPLTHGRLQHLG
ncbi:unnamed protein product [Pleuronectes platessa]|uniref:Uncharacterized protein n=1 Tax=Pleuronectes platessa TaxID=8262 RepID=A0A9N7UQ66_PLEPL|nr:unnamed protein product [Pleuronectes platessa]